MVVRRIVATVEAEDRQSVRGFCQDLLDLEPVMDLGWIITFAAEGAARPQISIASEGGSGTEVPDLSIEVDDIDAVLGRAQSAGLEILYGPTTEPWGVRQFFVRDPLGKLVNILAHAEPSPATG